MEKDHYIDNKCIGFCGFYELHRLGENPTNDIIFPQK
jgi:hypothetical protein